MSVEEAQIFLIPVEQTCKLLHRGTARTRGWSQQASACPVFLHDDNAPCAAEIDLELALQDLPRYFIMDACTHTE